jgi:hypothetical protein
MQGLLAFAVFEARVDLNFDFSASKATAIISHDLSSYPGSNGPISSFAFRAQKSRLALRQFPIAASNSTIRECFILRRPPWRLGVIVSLFHDNAGAKLGL